MVQPSPNACQSPADKAAEEMIEVFRPVEALFGRHERISPGAEALNGFPRLVEDGEVSGKEHDVEYSEHYDANRDIASRMVVPVRYGRPVGCADHGRGRGREHAQRVGRESIETRVCLPAVDVR